MTFLFIYLYLCNNAVNSSDHVALNDVTISELVKVWDDVVMVSFEVLSVIGWV